MSKVWMVRYEHGWLYLECFDVLKASPKQVTLKDGGAASGYRRRVAPDEVFFSERDAYMEARRIIGEKME